MLREYPNQAYLLDLDGNVLVGWEPLPGVEIPLRGSAIKYKLRDASHSLVSPSDYFSPFAAVTYGYSREPSRRELVSVYEKLDLLRHFHRVMYPDVREVIPTLREIYDNPHLVGAQKVLFGYDSGRRNQADWLAVTEANLIKEGFPVDIIDPDLKYFRPDKSKLKSKESKWLSIRHFLLTHPDFKVTLFDDDPEVGFYIAAQAKEYAPDRVRMVLIDRFPHMGEGVLYIREEMEQYKGILRREVSLARAIQSLLVT